MVRPALRYTLPADLAQLLARDAFPEQTRREAPIIHDFLEHRGAEYDAVEFSVRLGPGVEADPSHLPGVQRAEVHNSRARVDMVLRRGPLDTLCEVKERLTFGVIGQLHSYARLYQEDYPEAAPPALLAIGRSITPLAERMLTEQGVTVVVYERPDT